MRFRVVARLKSGGNLHSEWTEDETGKLLFATEGLVRRSLHGDEHGELRALTLSKAGGSKYVIPSSNIAYATIVVEGEAEE